MAEEITRPAESSVANVLPGILAALTKKINIKQLLAASGSLGDIDIEKIVFGTVKIDQVTLQNTSLKVQSASAFLKNVRIILTIDISFKFTVDLPIVPNINFGPSHIGTLSFPVSVGNIDVPSLQNIPITIPNVSVPDVTANVPPITNLDLGGGTFTSLEANSTTTPADGFQVSGLGLGDLTLSNLKLPRTVTQSASIQEFKPNSNIVIPSAQLSGLNLPAVKINDISANAFNFIADPSAQNINISAGPLGGVITLTPTAHVYVDSLELTGVSVPVTVGQTTVEKISLPVDIRGINLKNIEISQLNVNGLSL